MSTDINKNQLSNMGLTDIVAPTLSDTNFAESLNEVFDNINNNFGTLANREFVKGDGGKSIEIKEVEFFKEGDPKDPNNLTTYGRQLKECIEKLSDKQDEYAPVNINGKEFTVWTYFEENPGKLWMVYNTDSDINATAVATTSLYYVFLDGRYANDQIGFANQKDYMNLRDFSCILVYSTDSNGEGKFTALENAFPTIYYENGVGLSWKINGNGTGIPVQGVPGKDGSNATLFIVKGTPISESIQIGKNTKIEVLGVYEDYEGFREISSYDEEEFYKFNNQSALILASNNDKNNFYFGKINIETEIVDEKEVSKLYAYCTPSTSINSAINTEEIINSMKSINILGTNSNASSGLKGLFIPLESEKEDGTQKVHLLSATSITNNAASGDLKTDVLFTPIKDINSLEIDNTNEEKKLNVDKYLYVKLNKQHAISTANTIGGGDYLKYKLERVVLNRDSDYLGVFNGSNSGSRYYGKIKYIEYKGQERIENYVSISENTTAVVSRSTEPSIKPIDSMPRDFYNSLAPTASDITENTHGIYRWVLDETYAEYDPDELKIWQNGNNYSFDDSFKVIYTTTITPSTATKFMWFNGMMVDDDWKERQYAAGSDGSDTRYVIPGWTTSDEDPIFKFLKFVPVYTNKSFSVNTDTALNLNYNVNITGDAENPNKSITVHGDVNCDNLSVYKLTATGEIKNIYTKDDINAEKGINLSKNTDTGEYNCKIDIDGNINGNSLNVNTNITASHANINTIDTTEINGKDLDVNVYDDNSNVLASAHLGVSGACEKAVGVTLTNVHEIDVIACEHAELNEISKVPVITTNVPAHLNDNSNIVISNQANDSNNVYFKDTLKNSGEYNPGQGVSDSKNIHVTSFESAKNFNMQRLSLQAASGSNSSELISNETGGTSSLSKNGSKGDSYAWAVSQDKGQGSFSGWKSDFTISSSISAYIDKADNTYISKNYLQTTTITPSSGIFLSTKNNIDLNLTNYFWLVLGIWAGCSNGKWGLLHSDSYMRLRVYYSTDGSTYKQTNVYKDYKFDNSTSSNANDSGYEWSGRNEHGSNINSYDDVWRYRSYIFKPTKMTITPTSTGFTDIINSYNSGKNITFKIVPTFKIRAFGQNGKDLIGGVCVTCPRPISISNTSGISSTKLISGDKNGHGKYQYEIYSNSVTSCTGSISYTVTKSGASSSDVKATTICNDGMVIRAGGYVFGLGYAESVVDHSKNGYNVEATNNPHWDMINPNYYKTNIPVLFYHKHDNNYYNTNHTPKNGETNSEGYAQRMHAMPLEDIFKAIEILRNDDFKKYGL